MSGHHGTLWIVKQDMLAQHNYQEYIGNRKVLIEKGEIFEWRYESDNHFRTRDDRWFWVDDNTLNEYCLKIAKIDEKVCWNNKANTEEIWRLHLFEWIENGKEIYDRIIKETTSS
jgi:hypothetical protein